MMNIRAMTERDVPYMDVLMEQLGYPSSTEAVQQRLHRILHVPNYETYVAELNGQLVGFVGMCKQVAYEFDAPYVRVLALVVHEEYRRKNIGQSLMQAAEKWAKEQGCGLVTLNSGNREQRIAAHLFYEQLGYVGKSTGFSKKLTHM